MHYLISEEKLLQLISESILLDYIHSDEDSFVKYLIKEFPPQHDFIQSFCFTKAEKKDPIKNGIYLDITIEDIAKYILEKDYKKLINIM